MTSLGHNHFAKLPLLLKLSGSLNGNMKQNQKFSKWGCNRIFFQEPHEKHNETDMILQRNVGSIHKVRFGIYEKLIGKFSAHSGYALSQWETLLTVQCHLSLAGCIPRMLPGSYILYRTMVKWAWYVYHMYSEIFLENYIYIYVMANDSKGPAWMI